MEEYEVRNLYEKVHNSELEIAEILSTSTGTGILAQSQLQTASFNLSFQIENVSNRIEHHYKLELHIPKGLIEPVRSVISQYHVRDESAYSIYSIGNSTPLFQNELTTLITVDISLTPTSYRTLKLPILAHLYYSNGRKRKSFDISDSLLVKGQKLQGWGWKL